MPSPFQETPTKHALRGSSGAEHHEGTSEPAPHRRGITTPVSKQIAHDPCIYIYGDMKVSLVLVAMVAAVLLMLAAVQVSNTSWSNTNLGPEMHSRLEFCAVCTLTVPIIGPIPLVPGGERSSPMILVRL